MKKLFQMKKIYIACLAAMGLLSSCEEIIDYELRKGDEKVVIEALITDLPGPDTVRISKTKAYLEQGQTPRISNATVIVSDNEGNADTLRAIGDGKYITTKLEGKVGNTYYLRAEIDGQVYTAQSKMKPVSPIDTITYVYKKKIAGRDEGYYPTMVVQEPAGRGDFYLFDFYINGVKEKEISPINDDFYDGNNAIVDLFFTLQPNDRFKIVIYSLDEPCYNFYVGLQNQLYNTGSPFDSPPANTKSNISNGAIGLFQASSVASKEIVVEL